MAADAYEEEEVNFVTGIEAGGGVEQLGQCEEKSAGTHCL